MGAAFWLGPGYMPSDEKPKMSEPLKFEPEVITLDHRHPRTLVYPESWSEKLEQTDLNFVSISEGTILKLNHRDVKKLIEALRAWGYL